MEGAAKNAPLFLEAFHDACESLRQHGEIYAPDAAMINEVCDLNSIGYIIQPPDLIPRGSDLLVEVPKKPPSLKEGAIEQYERSIQRAEELLRDRHGREAVQETLWLLESVVNAGPEAMRHHDLSLSASSKRSPFNILRAGSFDPIF